MAVSPALLDQLLTLDVDERLEIAQRLLDTVEEEDTLEDSERARLHAALARSLEDIRAGRVRDAGDVLAELRARHRP